VGDNNGMGNLIIIQTSVRIVIDVIVTTNAVVEGEFFLIVYFRARKTAIQILHDKFRAAGSPYLMNALADYLFRVLLVGMAI